GVDTVGDEGTFAPAHHLLADTDAARQLADGVAVINEGVENFCTGGLGALLTVAITDVLEAAAFVLQFEVVPVFAAYEDTGVSILQLKVVYAFEDFRESLTTLEVQTTVVTGGGVAEATI